jgi:hypothetical protein
MELTNETHTAISLGARYERTHIAAKTADNAITHLRFELFTGLITDKEEDTLRAAAAICSKIAGKTSTHDAAEYFTTLKSKS